MKANVKKPEGKKKLKIVIKTNVRAGNVVRKRA